MQRPATPAESWQSRLKRLGREYFIVEEMIRLGFLEITTEQYQLLQDGYAQLNALDGELQRLGQELKGTEDITPLLKEIRRNRIERVRAKRALRKVDKARARQARREEVTRRKRQTPFYLGEGVSAGLQFTGTDAAKLAAAGLPVLHTLDDLAGASGLEARQWIWLSYHRRTARIDHYTRFEIPKKKGGTRPIAAPKRTLRQAQQWILEHLLNPRTIHPNAMAFLPGKNIRHNAEKHTGKAIVVRIDLKDFFPSVKYPRVKGLFRYLGYNEGIATVLALVCTDALRVAARLDGQDYFVALSERFLPQGTCTSPALTNILCGDVGYLDHRLTCLADKGNWQYSRYADDLVFSTPDPAADLKSLLGPVHKIVADEGFAVNPEKTRVMRPHQRQAVTGVLVNEARPKIGRQDLRRFRAFLHQLGQIGVPAMSARLGKDAKRYAQGYWAFVQMVQPEQAASLLGKHPWLRSK